MAACKVVSYCGREHQASERPEHKRVCNAIKRAHAALQQAEAELIASPGDWLSHTGATIFEEHAGHFWGIYETRPYMRARYGLVQALLKAKTYAAVEGALNHLLDLLRLCRRDNMGVRDLVPSLFLRLGKDQECYDFVKWWSTTGDRSDYDWGNMDQPYLDLKGENAVESPAFFGGKYPSLAHLQAVVLLKTQILFEILFDLRALKSAAALGERLPHEVIDEIGQRMVGNVASRYQDIVEAKYFDPLIEDLRTQMSDMYKAVQSTNAYFWPALLQPGANLTAQPEAYSMGSVEEMQLALQYSYDSWAETPGAIDLIRTLTTVGKS